MSYISEDALKNNTSTVEDLEAVLNQNGFIGYADEVAYELRDTLHVDLKDATLDQIQYIIDVVIKKSFDEAEKI